MTAFWPSHAGPLGQGGAGSMCWGYLPGSKRGRGGIPGGPGLSA